jgi:GTP-binding protein
MKPVVALVGRPNVGKSTLFNRLAGERLAIVDDTPGTTRDRIVAAAEWTGRNFDIVDTGGIDPTHGGRTPLSVDSADFIAEIRLQALVAVRDADAVLFITDGPAGVTPPDREVAEILRHNQKKVDGKPWPPILLVVNKCEAEQVRQIFAQYLELGSLIPLVQEINRRGWRIQRVKGGGIHQGSQKRRFSQVKLAG